MRRSGISWGWTPSASPPCTPAAAIARRTSMYQAFGLAQKLSTADLLQALGQSPPLSVTMKEHVDGLRDWARGRCSSAD